MKHTIDESGYRPGNPEFLGCLQDAITSLWSILSTTDQQKYAALAKQWSEEAPPKEVQCK
jgi:hypothetical protein